MTRSRTAAVGRLVRCALPLLLAPAAAEALPWAPIGLADAGITRLEASRAVFALAADGFYKWNTGTGTWDAYVEPGVPGRAVTAVAADSWMAVEAVAGRLDAAGHGFITVENLDGQPGQTVYQSTGGAVAAFAIDRWWFPLQADLWAVIRAGDQPGEVVHSDDGGLTWAAVPGHGMTDATGVFVITRYHQPGVVYVSGDAGVVRTFDSGATWEGFGDGLPAGPITILQTSSEPVAIPAKDTDGMAPFLAATASGLYACHDDSSSWTPVLAEDCRRVDTRYAIYNAPTVYALTADNRLLTGDLYPFAEPVWDDWTSEFPGQTIVDAAAGTDIFVLTESAGIYRYSPVSAVPPVPGESGAEVAAAPNPFNPAAVVSYTAPRAGFATLRAYDVAGRLVDTLLAGPVDAGPGEVAWRPRRLGSGVYLLRFEVGGAVATTRVTLAK